MPEGLRSRWSFLREPTALAGAVVLAVLVLGSLLAPLAAPYSPESGDLRDMLQPPGAKHLLGTDDLGRDILSRLLHGGRITLLMGLVAVGLGLGLGAPVGFVAGASRGMTDSVLSRGMDILLAFPPILLALLIMAGLGPSLTNAMIAVGVVQLPKFGRIARACVLVESRREYVLAARAGGCGTVRIYLRHLLPNCLAPLVVTATLAMGTAILEASALSFLGLGAQPPTPEWGAMLSAGRGYLRTAPHVALFPGLFIFLTVLGFTLLGDRLRDWTDPRLIMRQ